MLPSQFDNLNKIFDSFKKIEDANPFNKMPDLMEPFRKTQQITERFKQITEPLNVIRERLQILHDPFAEIVQQMKRAEEGITNVIKSTPENLLLLAEYGWYLNLDTEFGLPIRLGRKIKKGDIVSVDSYLMEYYTSNLDSIISDLSKKHPDRKEIFGQIQQAHKSGFYLISIPAILAQVDGVCHDFTMKYFFVKIKKKGPNQYLPEVANEISKITDSFMECFLSPIFADTPIIAHHSTLHTFQVKLNRHTIMHGIDKDYGYEINSLKCLSLLSYMSDILSKLNEDPLDASNI